MTDLFTIAVVTGPAWLVLKAWLLLSMPVAALLCWLFHNADPRSEAGLAVRGRPSL